VWTADQARKLASIGIAVRRWVTFHGFALNVTTDLSAFSAINPCGLEARVMSSLHAEGARRTVEELKPLAADCLGQALGRQFAGPAPLC
jgi:lipoyl(octanoyl) transferase